MLAPNTHLKERYRILHKIGGGGFGLVYKAIDEVFGCCVAIKGTKEEVVSHDSLKKAFEREAKLLRSLRHDCLPRVTDYFFHDGTQFLVMDFIEGEDLAALLKQRLGHEGPFTVSEILPWADRILSALEYLHSRPEPIIHRDIKPSNIKLDDDGGIYLLDFGLAKGSVGQMSTMLQGQSSFSLAAFTHAYAPLEQLRESGTQPQSDVYAFGATLYHLLTGHLPIAASERDEAIQRGRGDPLRPAHEANPEIPIAISQIISQAMTIRWWDRLGSAKEMRAGLSVAVGDVPLRKPKVEANLDLGAPFAQPSGESIPQAPHHVAAISRSSVATAPIQAALNSPRLRRPWIVVSLSMVFLAAISVGGWWVYTRWLAPASRSSTTTPTHSETSSVLATPTSLYSRQPTGHKGTVWSVAFSRDGSLAASGGEDKTIILWDTNNDWKHKFPEPLTSHESPVYSVAFSPDGKTLASAGKNGTIILWNVQTGKPETLQKSAVSPEWTSLVAFSPDDSAGAIMVSISPGPSSGSQEIRVWSERTRWQSRTIPVNPREGKIFALAVSPDGNTLATAGESNIVRLSNLRDEGTFEDLGITKSEKTSVVRLAFSANGKYLAAGTNHGVIRMWRTENWEEMKSFEIENNAAVTGIAFSPDNATLVGASSDQALRLWNLTTGSPKKLATFDEISQLAFSPDGQTLLSGGKKKGVTVWQGRQIPR